MMVNNSQSCCKLLQAVDEASFYMQDLKLYLDTHPNDAVAVKMFREAVRQYKACKEAFENSCYPLQASGTKDDDCWDWLMGTWPPKSL